MSGRTKSCRLKWFWHFLQQMQISKMVQTFNEFHSASVLMRWVFFFFLSQCSAAVPGAASPRLRGLRGAAAGVCSLQSSSHESGVVGETAAVLAGLLSGCELLVEDLFVTLVIMSGPGEVAVNHNQITEWGEQSRDLCSYIQILHIIFVICKCRQPS